MDNLEESIIILETEKIDFINEKFLGQFREYIDQLDQPATNEVKKRTSCFHKSTQKMPNEGNPCMFLETKMLHRYTKDMQTTVSNGGSSQSDKIFYSI